jgi:hypothetical protein
MTTRKEEFEFDKEILAKTFSNVNAIGHEQEVYDFLVQVMFGSKELVDVREFLDNKIVTYSSLESSFSRARTNFGC